MVFMLNTKKAVRLIPVSDADLDIQIPMAENALARWWGPIVRGAVFMDTHFKITVV